MLSKHINIIKKFSLPSRGGGACTPSGYATDISAIIRHDYAHNSVFSLEHSLFPQENGVFSQENGVFSQ